MILGESNSPILCARSRQQKTQFQFEPINSLSYAELIHQSEQALFVFLKEYDICPRTLTKSTAFLLYHDILDTPTEVLTHAPESANSFPYLI